MSKVIIHLTIYLNKRSQYKGNTITCSKGNDSRDLQIYSSIYTSQRISSTGQTGTQSSKLFENRMTSFSHQAIIYITCIVTDRNAIFELNPYIIR